MAGEVIVCQICGRAIKTTFVRICDQCFENECAKVGVFFNKEVSYGS